MGGQCQQKSEKKLIFFDIIKTYLLPLGEGNGRTTREFIREYANHKSEELPIPTINFSWSNVDQDTINEFIDKSRAFRSAIELEILKALEPKEKEKTY